ncbi:hypothetical protein V3C99_018892 [Haemonchus contortus]|uniref:Reverse transcriptase domain-containing protein n=1 Tax=Haemonchus contortus TaxID=6289 RepID=A0A7I4Z019_HAECO
MFIDSKRVFDTVDTEAVTEVPGNLCVPVRNIRMLRELHSNFTARHSIKSHHQREERCSTGENISPKLFSATLKNSMRRWEWEDLGGNDDGRCLNHLCFADDIVLNIEQAERLPATLTVLVERSAWH